MLCPSLPRSTLLPCLPRESSIHIGPSICPSTQTHPRDTSIRTQCMSRVYAVVHRTYTVHARSYQRTHRTCAASSSATTSINFWHQHATIARAPDTTAIVKFFLATPALLLTDYAFNNYAYAVLRSDFLMIFFLFLHY